MFDTKSNHQYPRISDAITDTEFNSIKLLLVELNSVSVIASLLLLLTLLCDIQCVEAKMKIMAIPYKQVMEIRRFERSEQKFLEKSVIMLKFASLASS